MTAIDRELDHIKDLTVSMMELVGKQLQRSRTALKEHDLQLAGTILRHELRVNEMELAIEKACEHAIALYQPVATDLRFILAVFKTVSELERLADHLEGIARVIIDKEIPFEQQILCMLNTEEMFEQSQKMFDDILCALNDSDTDMARSVFKKDKFLNKTFRKSTASILEQLSNDQSDSRELLRLFQVLYRLERVGDLLTNIAELIIFYLDAITVKHQKKKVKANLKTKKNGTNKSDQLTGDTPDDIEQDKDQS
jgi:phosphate transport system protein